MVWRYIWAILGFILGIIKESGNYCRVQVLESRVQGGPPHYSSFLGSSLRIILKGFKLVP